MVLISYMSGKELKEDIRKDKLTNKKGLSGFKLSNKIPVIWLSVGAFSWVAVPLLPGLFGISFSGEQGCLKGDGYLKAKFLFAQFLKLESAN